MVSQYGIKLAVNIISSHFGDVVAKVCECLLRKGTLSLADLVRYTQLKNNQVKNCLLVLIQHSCVQAFSVHKDGAFGDAPKVVTLYTVLFDNILHRLRFSKFLGIVSDELDKECKGLLQALLEHGRLTLEQILHRAQSMSNQNDWSTAVQNALRESFVKLVNARYVERCPDPEPLIAPPEDEDTPSSGKRSAKATKLAKKTAQTVEQRAITAAAPLESKRFAIMIDTGNDAGGEETAGQPPNMKVGEKRKYGELEMDRETMVTISEKEVLWRANFEAFIRRLRHKACVVNVMARLDDGAGTVLNAMLEATKNAESKVKTENSVPLSMDTIFEEVIKSKEGRTMTLERVKAALRQLGCHSSARGAEDLFSVDLRSIIESAQNEEVESIVLKRYGTDAYRIFRLLSKTGRLVETDKISDTTFVEKKETIKILYSLWKDNFLHMEKITSHGSKQSEFLLWKVDKSSVWENTFDEMSHAALNLSQRMAYELEKEHEIARVPEEKLVGALIERYKHLKGVKSLLKLSLMKLDDGLMLFHDF